MGYLPRIIQIPGTNQTINFVGIAGDACSVSYASEIPLTALHMEISEPMFKSLLDFESFGIIST